MRTSWLPIVLALAAACGGSSKSAPATAPAATAAPAALPEYCEGYSGCADEAVRDDFDNRSDDELSADERAALTAAVADRLSACGATWAGLTPHQQTWLEACTGCGGSCDVYDCLDQAGAIGEGDTFACDTGAGDDDAGDDDAGDDE
ncbi:MAG: hypothetical protein IPL61_33485 [Myxococcales bacterium]|nr:hypothetical protein [Myxococcales bacterium]